MPASFLIGMLITFTAMIQNMMTLMQLRMKEEAPIWGHVVGRPRAKVRVIIWRRRLPECVRGPGFKRDTHFHYIDLLSDLATNNLQLSGPRSIQQDAQKFAG